MSNALPTYTETLNERGLRGSFVTDGPLATLCVGQIFKRLEGPNPVTVGELHAALQQCIVAGLHPDTIVGSLTDLEGLS